MIFFLCVSIIYKFLILDNNQYSSIYILSNGHRIDRKKLIIFSLVIDLQNLVTWFSLPF
jgi:hypothetical protein